MNQEKETYGGVKLDDFDDHLFAPYLPIHGVRKIACKRVRELVYRQLEPHPAKNSTILKLLSVLAYVSVQYLIKIYTSDSLTANVK